MKERDSRFELLRIVSMILIVVCHTILLGKGLRVNNQYNLEFINKNFFDSVTLQFLASFGRMGNNLFIMITGYFMINSSFRIEKIFKILSPIHFYSLISFFVAWYFNVLGLRLSLFLLFPVLFQTYWFVGPYLLLILISPYLNIIVKNLSLKKNITLIFILVFVCSIIPTFTFTASLNPGFKDIGIFIILYLFSANCRLYFNGKMFRNISWLLVLGLFPQLINIVLFDVVGIAKNNLFFINNANYLNSQESFFLLIASIAIFLLFFNMKPFNNSIINKISALTFGVYLIHQNPIFIRGIYFSSFVSSIYTSQFRIFLLVLLALSIYFSASLIELIRSKIFNKSILYFFYQKIFYKWNIEIFFNKLKLYFFKE